MTQSRKLYGGGFSIQSALLPFTVALVPWAAARADEYGMPFWLSGYAVTTAQ